MKLHLIFIYLIFQSLGYPLLSQTIFEDKSQELGVKIDHYGDETSVHGTGAVWLDIENDGDLDLYVTNQRGGNRLFRNNLSEDQVVSFTDITTGPLTGEGKRGSGVTAADYNNDGLIDLFLSNLDEDVLLQNTGNGNFIDVTAEAFGISEEFQPGAGSTASWGDINNDGWLDLYISNHAFGPDSPISTNDYLYLSNGGNPVTFTDISFLIAEDTDSSGISDRAGFSFVSLFTDFNNDNLIDIFTTNDCTLGNEGNKLWKNHGDVNLTEVSREIGPFTRGTRSSPHCYAPMGISAGDPNHDGLIDYHLTNLHSVEGENTVLLLNNGQNLFNVSRFAGLDENVFEPQGGILATWGTVFIDYDLDAWQDLAVAAGSLGETFQPNILYRNLGSDIGGIPRFKEVSREQTGLGDGQRARTIIMGDYDNDGDPDLFLCNYNGTSMLYRNKNENSNSWLIVELKGAGAPLSNKNGIGAKVKVTDSNNISQFYEISSGSSIGGGNHIAAYFGLADAEVVDLEITWPSGVIQKKKDVEVNQRIAVSEPQTKFTYPTGGEYLQQNTTHELRWESVTDEVVDIILNSSEGFQTVIATSVENSGSYSWTIDSNTPIGQTFWIETRSAIDGRFMGRSHGNFSITSDGSFLKLTNPIGPNSLEQLDTVSITWDSNLNEAISLFLMEEDDTISTLTQNQENSGIFEWVVSNEHEGNNFSIQISTDNGLSDRSKRTFSIVKNYLEKEDLIIPVIDTTGKSVARIWNEMLLHAIRNDFARPTVHARNLFHLSAAMYDAWAVYEPQAATYFLGNQIAGFEFPFEGIRTPFDTVAAQEEAISYAAYRLLKHRFRNNPNPNVQAEFDILFTSLGYNPAFTSTDYSDGRPRTLGNYIAEKVIEFGLQDGSNEINDYENTYYEPVNPAIKPLESGQSLDIDPNRWQPLTFENFIDQSGNPIGQGTPDFLSPEWGNVVPFALNRGDLEVTQRDGNRYNVFHNPGEPVKLSQSADDKGSDHYKWGFSLVSIWSAHLDPEDGVLWDISPASQGNIQEFPSSPDQYNEFYNLLDGGDTGQGYEINPSTGAPYEPQLVPRGDYTRILAEFWADGPDSETPPGHWFTILNYVSDHPQLEKKFEGRGPTLSDLEWDIKSYFALGGAMHDVAISAWSIKGYYDYVRPISAIRYMGMKGQSTDPDLPNYDPQGIELVPGFVELIEEDDPLAGDNEENIGKIKLKAWRGHEFINDPAIDKAGVGWVLAESWVPYQRPTFVTPPFAGYVSGHSTYSRAAAEVLTMITGDEYFPGGMSEFVAKKNEFLVFERGPSVDVVLQWATYRDAADQCSLSRIWGGIHPPVDDIPGRKIGEIIGVDAFHKAKTYFEDRVLEIKVPQSSGLIIYPNPLESNTLYIKSNGENEVLQARLTDISGRQYEIKKRLEKEEGMIELHFSNLSSGLYILELETQKGIFAEKVIKR